MKHSKTEIFAAIKQLLGKILLYIFLFSLILGLMRAIMLRLNLFPNLDNSIIYVIIPVAFSILICYLTRKEVKRFKDYHKAKRSLLLGILELLPSESSRLSYRMAIQSFSGLMSFLIFLFVVGYVDHLHEPSVVLHPSLSDHYELLSIGLILVIGCTILFLIGYSAGILTDESMKKDEQEDKEARKAMPIVLLVIVLLPFYLLKSCFTSEQGNKKSKKKKA
jgi:hypothetical protein